MAKVILCKSKQKIYVPEVYISGSLKQSHTTDDGLNVVATQSYINIQSVDTVARSVDVNSSINMAKSYLKGNVTNLLNLANSEDQTDIVINDSVYLQLSRIGSVLINTNPPFDLTGGCFKASKNGVNQQWSTIIASSDLPTQTGSTSIAAVQSSIHNTYEYPTGTYFIVQPMIVEAIDSDGYRLLCKGWISVHKVYRGIGFDDYVWISQLTLAAVPERFAEEDNPLYFNYKWIGLDVIPDPLKPTDTTGGGDGDGDTSSDTVSLPDIEGLNNSSAVNNGLVNLYKLDNVQMRALGRYLWSDDFIDNIKKLKQSPMDAIISLMSMPVPIGSGTTDNIKVGNLTSTSTGVIVPQYIKIDCGSVYINKLVGNALDYSPYTRVEVCLPFCGNHILDTDDVMGKNVSITYYVDLLSGSCIAFLSAEGQVLYNYSGSCGTGVPLSAVDRSAQTKAMVNMIANSIGAVAAGAGAAFGAPTGGQALSMASGAFQSGMDTMMAKNQIEHAGSISGDSGVMGFKKPYFIIERPNNAIPADYDSIKGYPSNIKVAHLSEMKGYTEVGYMNLTGFSEATAEEINEIETLLYSGVIL